MRFFTELPLTLRQKFNDNDSRWMQLLVSMSTWLSSTKLIPYKLMTLRFGVCALIFPMLITSYNSSCSSSPSSNVPGHTHTHKAIMGGGGETSRGSNFCWLLHSNHCVITLSQPVQVNSEIHSSGAGMSSLSDGRANCVTLNGMRSKALGFFCPSTKP